MTVLDVLDAERLLDAVAAHLVAETGLLVGKGEAPPRPATASEWYPHLILHLIDGAQFAGDMAAPFSLPGWPVQVDAVGEVREQAAKAQDRARRAILDLTLPIEGDGIRVSFRAPDGSAGGPVPVGSLWQASDRYRMTVTT